MNARYVTKKILTNIVILFIVITLNFFLPRLIFKDPAQPYYAGVPEDQVLLREEIRKEYGFDKPVYVQYFKYLGRIFTLNFGTSYYYRDSVIKVMFGRIPWSVMLSLSAMLISVFIGILYGAIAAKNRGRWQDNALLKLSTVTTALPAFWIALVFVMLLAFVIPIFPYNGAMTAGYALQFRAPYFLIGLGITAAATVGLYLIFKKLFLLIITPIVGVVISLLAAIPYGDISDLAYHAFLPIAVICIGSSVGYALMVRNSMITTVNEDYILTARAKGLPESKILFRHAFRNSLLPVVTSFGMSLAGIFGGSVLIEKIFSWPGMGTLLLDANNHGDFQLAQALLLFFAIITIVCNLLTDIIYHRLDPRVKTV